VEFIADTYGSFTGYLTWHGFRHYFWFFKRLSIISYGSIDNVSVKEVGQDWTLGTGWSVGSGLASKSSGTASNLFQSNVLVVGLAYKVTFTLSNYSNGNVTPYCGGTGAGTSRASNGTFTEIIIALTSTTFFLVANSTFTGSVTNISVKEVGQDWTLGTGWSIGDDKVIATSVSNQFVTQSFAFTSGKRYRASFSVTGTSSLPNNTSLRLPYDGWGSSIAYVNQNSDGVYSNEFVSGGSPILYLGGGSFTGTITNISIIEITDDTNLPRINYEGFSYQDSLGSELVTNGDFATDTGWSKSANTTISGGQATFAANGLTQSVMERKCLCICGVLSIW
jgi:hypothetical protein